MCSGGVICLCADFYFCDLALGKSSTKLTSSSSHRNVTCSHRDIDENCSFHVEQQSLTIILFPYPLLLFQETRICMPVPLYHCFGMVIGSLQMVTHGSTCVFPSPGFEAGATLHAASTERLLILSQQFCSLQINLFFK